jgi:hypothetical protein
MESILREYMRKKSLKIPKEKSETVNRRRTDNTMVKQLSTKHYTEKIQQHELH